MHIAVGAGGPHTSERPNSSGLQFLTGAIRVKKNVFERRDSGEILFVISRFAACMTDQIYFHFIV